MRFKYSKLLAMLLIFTSFLTILSPVILAEEAPGFELPVTVKLRGWPPTGGEDYKIVLKADNLGYPMPEDSEDGIYNLIITGESTVKLPKIRFSSRGIYTYTIYQLSGTNPLATYDDTRYNLVVYVTNADGSDLEITVILYLLGEEGKLDEVIFENDYRRVPPSPPPSDPDPDPDPDPTPTTPITPTTPEESEEPEEEPIEEEETEEIDEELSEGVPEVDAEEEEEEIIDEPVPEGQSAMPKTGDTQSTIFYGLGAILIALGLGNSRRRKK